MTISPELFYAILAMDSYNRGYEGGLADNGTADPNGLGDDEGTKIGTATVGQAIVGWVVPRPLRGFTHHLCHRDDRIATAHPWARLARGGMAQQLDRRTRAQIRTGSFRVRLKPEGWQSGGINRLLDVIAPDRKATGQVTANLWQVVKEGDLRIHPQVAGLVDDEMMERMGAVAQSVAKENK